MRRMILLPMMMMTTMMMIVVVVVVVIAGKLAVMMMMMMMMMICPFSHLSCHLQKTSQNIPFLLGLPPHRHRCAQQPVDVTE